MSSDIAVVTPRRQSTPVNALAARSSRHVPLWILRLGAGTRAASLALPFALLMGTMLAMPAGVSAQEEELLGELREGGYVLVIRHMHTDRSRGDARRVDLEDRTTQRNLSDRGRDEARSLGRVIAELGIPVGEVVTSPYFRTLETAELAFGRFEVDGDLAYSGSRIDFRRLLEREVPEGQNRVLVTHAGVFRPVISGARAGEGDTIVLRPSGDSFEVVAVIRLETWKELEK